MPFIPHGIEITYYGRTYRIWLEEPPDLEEKSIFGAVTASPIGLDIKKEVQDDPSAHQLEEKIQGVGISSSISGLIAIGLSNVLGDMERGLSRHLRPDSVEESGVHYDGVEEVDIVIKNICCCYTVCVFCFTYLDIIYLIYKIPAVDTYYLTIILLIHILH